MALQVPLQIPLHCIICSRGFSDLSHLLTHIQSKGHLALFYKLQCEARTDLARKSLYDAHMAWYTFYEIEALVIVRMQEKDRKKKTVKAANAAMTISSNSSRTTPSTIDPQLGPKIKTEPKSRSTTPLPRTRLPFHDRRFAPPMQGISATSDAFSQASRETSALTSLYTTTSSDAAEDTDSPVPAKRGPKRKHDNIAQDQVDQEDDTDLAAVLDQEPKKLKGVIWPGMAQFDAASPETKRRRNQKKDVSVLKNLKKTSEVISKKELVFDAEGQLQRQREITGNPDIEDEEGRLKGESSPEPSSSSKKKKTTRRARKALTKKNANTGRTTRARKGGKTEPLPILTNNKPKRGPYFADQASNDDLTYGQFRPNNTINNNVGLHHGHGLNTHRDHFAPPPQITFNNPPNFNLLTQGIRNPLQLPTNNLGTFGQLNHNPFGFPGQQMMPFNPFPFNQQLQQQEQPFDFLTPYDQIFDDEATVSPPSTR